jgi:hypothetical protein
LPPDLSHESLKAVAADRAPGGIGFGQRRGGGQLVADEQRQALEHHIDIAASAGDFAGHTIEPGLEEVVDLLGRPPVQPVAQRIIDDPALLPLAPLANALSASLTCWSR